MSIITLTAGEQSENHVGMVKQGDGLAPCGFTFADLKHIKNTFQKLDCKCILKTLNNALIDDSDAYEQSEGAYLLIIRNGISKLIGDHHNLFLEQSALSWDTKYFDVRRNKVLNKSARYNLCYNSSGQDPDYKHKKGTVIPFDSVPLTKKIMINLHKFFGDKAKNLQLEGNYYYDIKKCGIGYHGDSERKIVIGFRLGDSSDLHFNWFYKSKSTGKHMSFQINGGDIYVFSEKATGYDWKKRNIYTLRHATGCDKYVTLKK